MKHFIFILTAMTMIISLSACSKTVSERDIDPTVSEPTVLEVSSHPDSDVTEVTEIEQKIAEIIFKPSWLLMQ